MTIYCGEGYIGPYEIGLDTKWINGSSDTKVLAMVRKMAALSEHPYLIDTHCGEGQNFKSIEEFTASFEAAEIRSASVTKKRELSAVRRRQFNTVRAELVLALIERDGYVCAHPGCNVVTNLTIDHIVALSKGGADELSNLRLLCRSHNSEKSDR